MYIVDDDGAEGGTGWLFMLMGTPMGEEKRHDQHQPAWLPAFSIDLLEVSPCVFVVLCVYCECVCAFDDDTHGEGESDRFQNNLVPQKLQIITPPPNPTTKLTQKCNH